MSVQERYKKRFEILEKELQPSSLTGKNEYSQCGLCCYKRPCLTTPDEIKNIAAYLKLPILDLIKKYFVIDQLDDE